MTLDLRRDFSEVYDHLLERVRAFDPAGGNVLGDPGPVRLLTVGFEYSQDGWLVLAFDCRADADWDGEWDHVIEASRLDRPHWQAAGEAGGPHHLIQPDGSTTVVAAGVEPAEWLGKLLTAVVLKARADGVFAAMPKADGCELWVTHFSGAYDWPRYEDRGRDNLI